MYITIEELSTQLSVPISNIRHWLEAGYFSKEAYFNVNNVCRFDLDKVILELHSDSFGSQSKTSQNIKSTTANVEIPEINKILLEEYKHLVSKLLLVITNNLLLPGSMIEKLRDFEDEFTSGYDFQYATSSLHDAVSVLERYQLNEVISKIIDFITSTYPDDEDRRTLLDNIGVLNDLGKVQTDMQDKLDKYISFESNTRDEMLKYIGADYESLEDIVSRDDALLEEIEEIMTNFENASIQSDENSKIIMEMRQSLFSNIYDFNNKSFVTRETP